MMENKIKTWSEDAIMSKHTSTLCVTTKFSKEINPTLRVHCNVQVWIGVDPNDNFIYDDIEVLDLDTITYMNKEVSGRKAVSDLIDWHKNVGVDIWDIVQTSAESFIRSYPTHRFVETFSDYQTK